MATERLALILETLGADKAVGQIKQVGKAVGGIAESTGVGTSGLKNLSVAGTSLGDVLGNKVVVGALGAGAAIGVFAAASAKSFVEATASVREFQRASGASAEDASKLVFAMEHLGIPTETASRAVFMLGKNLEVNGKKLAGFGVNAVRGADGTTDLGATLLSVVDAFQNTSDAGERATLVQAAFGKSGLALLPILSKGRDGIAELFDAAERSGHVFSDGDLQTGKEFGLAMKELKADLEEVGLVVGRVVVPVFTDLIGILDGAVNGAKGLVGALSSIPGVSQVFEGVSVWGHAAGVAIDWLAQKDDQQTGTAEDNAAANEDAAGALDERTAAADKFSKSVFAAADADQAVADASHAIAKLQREQTDAQKDYNELLKKGAVDEAKVADARRSLAEATRSVGHAQRDQAKAQKEYNEALANANDLHGYDTAQEKLADAGGKLADANDNVASALDRQKDAAADLAKARAGDPDYQSKLADAKQKVADKTDAIKDATDKLSKKEYEAVKAHDAEKTAIEGNSAAAQLLLADLKALVKFHPNLMAALAPEIALLSSLGPVVAGWKPLAPGIAGPPSPILGTGLGGAAGPPVPTQPLATPIVHPAGFIGPLLPGQTVAAGPTTNNFTINATGGLTDAQLIAREVMWNLN